ncbi:MAG: hypothetical protein WCC65_14830, partial [Pseudonocardiaceae bacterium]
MRVQPRAGWLVLVAVAVVGLTDWWKDILPGPSWLKILVGVGATLAAAFAQSYVEWVRERVAARRRGRAVSERPSPSNPAGLLRADRHIVPFTGRD